MALNWNSVPNLPPNLRALGMSFNALCPNRDSASDGAWGDPDHKLSPSGHNLDDTPGSLPESEDSDWKPELRAIDVDNDLRKPGVNMQALCDAIARSSDRNRLSYIIYNGRIIGQFNGWAKWTSYSGDNPHDKHAHFSGDPDYDETGTPFTSITQFGDDDMPSWDDKIGGNTGHAGRTFREVIQDVAVIREWLRGVPGSAPFPPPENSTLRNLELIKPIDTQLDRVETGITGLTNEVKLLTDQLSQLVTLLKDTPR
jgi:hypothetical protein